MIDVPDAHAPAAITAIAERVLTAVFDQGEGMFDVNALHCIEP
jgi:hypothetical protein